MKKIWVNIAHSFKEAEKFDKNYYAQMPPEEKWDTMQFIRETYQKLMGDKHENGKRLRRVLRISKQSQS